MYVEKQQTETPGPLEKFVKLFGLQKHCSGHICVNKVKFYANAASSKDGATKQENSANSFKTMTTLLTVSDSNHLQHTVFDPIRRVVLAVCGCYYLAFRLNAFTASDTP